MIVVLSCGARKSSIAQPANQLYTGSYFKTGYRWARSVVPPRAIFILSAMHGLIPSDKVIEPYNMRLGQPGCVTALIVKNQAEKLGILLEHSPIILGGQDYVDIARVVWPDCLVPFGAEAGVKGIGYALKRMNEQMGRVPC